MAQARRQRSRFGSVRQLPSGRWQAHYVHDGAKITAPHTFLTKTDARGWLKVHETHHAAGMTPPTEAPAAVPTFGAYADAWLAGRDLRPRTRQQYRAILDRHLVPAFGTTPLDQITPATVRTWYGTLPADRPTWRAHTYALLRTILSTAVDDDLVPVNPCRVRGGGSAKRARDIRPATLGELAAITEATPDRYRVMVLLTAWLGLRFGEVTELRRRDVDLAAGTVRVERAVTRTTAHGVHVGEPKTAAGRRTVAVPPHLLPAVRAHLARFVPATPDGLLFASPTGGHLAPSSVYGWFYPAREAAGRPDLRFHDLRHTGATLAAATGATLAELMARLGHSTPAMALRYQHAAADRDRVIAAALSDLAAGQVVPISTEATGAP